MSNQLKLRRSRGFTLVEMAIVLVIIGLIISAVSVGKDTMRQAQQQKIATKFLGGWANSYNDYYSRTGVVVGDNLQIPTGFVGGVAGGTDTTPTTVMDTAGITYPTGKGKTAEEYNYIDAEGTPHDLTISFVNCNTTSACAGILGNAMELQYVTPSLGKALDSQFDDTVNYQKGNFRTASPWAASTPGGTASTVTAYWKMQE